MKKILVGIQLYTLRNEMQADFEGTLKLVHDLGYDGVEFAGLFGHSAEEVKALCAKYDLVPVAAHVPLADMMKDPDGIMATYAAIGMPYIVMPYLPEDNRPATRDPKAIIADVRFVCEKAKAHGLKMLYHNHDFEFEKVNGEYFLDLLYRSIPSDLLETEIDTCWVNVAGEEPSEYLKKYTGRTPVVHLKDFYKKGKAENMYELIGIKQDGVASEETFGFRPVGYGMQDMPKIVATSIETGAKWVVVEQDRPAPGQTPVESAKLSRDYLTKIGY